MQQNADFAQGRLIRSHGSTLELERYWNLSSMARRRKLQLQHYHRLQNSRCFWWPQKELARRWHSRVPKWKAQKVIRFEVWDPDQSHQMQDFGESGAARLP